MLLDIPPERIDMLMKLKNKYRTFLLSNTNVIHFNYYTDNLRKAHLYESLSDLFEKDYFSFLMNMRKPDAEIYEFVLSENGLIAEETIFIDDSILNIQGAEKVGITGKYLPAGAEIVDFMKSLVDDQ